MEKCQCLRNHTEYLTPHKRARREHNPMNSGPQNAESARGPQVGGTQVWIKGKLHFQAGDFFTVSK